MKWSVVSRVLAGLVAMAAPASAQPLCTAGAHLVHAAASASASHVDLVALGRNVARDQGMVAARHTLEGFALFQDASRGGFEREVMRAVRDASYHVEDSVEAWPRRDEVLFLFVNGLGQTSKSVATKLVTDGARRLRAEGFAAEVLKTSPYDSTESNARGLLPELKRMLAEPNVRHVVVVAASKGAPDLVEALAMSDGHPAYELTPHELGKIRYVVSLSGVVRGSAVAGWLVGSKSLLPRLVRSFMRAPVVGKFPHLEGVRSLARDPWPRLLETAAARHLRFVWVSFAVFPDGADGLPKMGFVRTRILRSFEGSVAVGPYDGLTESASALLPPGTGLEQWIVRIRGAHGMIKGSYLDGTPVVAGGTADAAWQIVHPLLRTLPIARP
jgi:hypothetical protein